MACAWQSWRYPRAPHAVVSNEVNHAKTSVNQ
jgi:hypothetical protein